MKNKITFTAFTGTLFDIQKDLRTICEKRGSFVADDIAMKGEPITIDNTGRSEGEYNTGGALNDSFELKLFDRLFCELICCSLEKFNHATNKYEIACPDTSRASYILEITDSLPDWADSKITEENSPVLYSIAFQDYETAKDIINYLGGLYCIAGV